MTIELILITLMVIRDVIMVERIILITVIRMGMMIIARATTMKIVRRQTKKNVIRQIIRILTKSDSTNLKDKNT